MMAPKAGFSRLIRCLGAASEELCESQVVLQRALATLSPLSAFRGLSYGRRASLIRFIAQVCPSRPLVRFSPSHP